MRLSREGWMLSGIAVADLVTTVLLVNSHAAEEGNPWMAHILAHGVWAFICVKVIVCAVPLFILEYVRRSHPRLVTSAMRIGIAGYLTLYIAVAIPQINAFYVYEATAREANQPLPQFAAIYDAAIRNHPELRLTATLH